jgi:hypothetical protein
VLWGHPSTNNANCPESDSKYINYLQFQKEWCAYSRTYLGMARDSMVAKSFTIREFYSLLRAIIT